MTDKKEKVKAFHENNLWAESVDTFKKITSEYYGKCLDAKIAPMAALSYTQTGIYPFLSFEVLDDKEIEKRKKDLIEPSIDKQEKK